MATDTPFEHELPDDVNRWPSNPTALLGVVPDVSRRDLKRAYTRLIRRFKPEHAPEQFRRLREAYEQLDQRLEWREAYESHLFLQREQKSGESGDDDSDTGPESSVEPNRDGDESTADAEAPDIVLRPVGGQPEDEGRNNGLWRLRASSNEDDQLWQQALDGDDLQQVYLQLVELAAQRSPTEIGYARLYWLLTIRPEFDVERDPCAWLIEGFRQHGLNGRLLILFTNDVRRRSGNVPLAVTEPLFDDGEPANRLVDLAQTRWRAARALSRFDVIGTDVERLRARLLDEPYEWQRLLCAAVRQLVMVRSKRAESLLAAVRAELGGITADVTTDWLWESLESTVALHEVWADESKPLLKGVPFSARQHTRQTLGRLAKLVEVTWECSPLQARSELLAVCVALTSELQTSLSELTWIAKVSRPLVRRLLELLHEQRSEFGDDEVYEITPAVEDELRRFVRGELCDAANSKGSTVLRFCLREAVTPQDVATMIEQLSKELPDRCIPWAESLRYDLPLNCLVEAQRLVW